MPFGSSLEGLGGSTEYFLSWFSPLLIHVLVGARGLSLLLVQQINFLLNQITWELFGKVPINQKHQSQSCDCVGAFLSVHFLKALVASVI